MPETTRRRTPRPIEMPLARARAHWIAAQGLAERAPFGCGPEATVNAIRHLGYVQIDTINVIERSHHHILFSRIPDYRKAHLRQAQAVDKAVFEYWTHALAYIPAEDWRFFAPEMKARGQQPAGTLSKASAADIRKVMRLVRENGSISIRDIADDVLIEKDHAWASRKPSKRALQRQFYTGRLTVSAREGMLKSYSLPERHFGWERRPRPATENQILDYMLERALRAQAIVSLDSVCYGAPTRKRAMRDLIEKRVRARRLVPVRLEGDDDARYWMRREAPDIDAAPAPTFTHILSPFDPLIIQRKRLERFFGYAHLFEAYVPAHKRVLGYFALPVLMGETIVAAIDCKADRAAGRLLIQNWSWIEEETPERRHAIEDELARFEAFQLGD